MAGGWGEGKEGGKETMWYGDMEGGRVGGRDGEGRGREGERARAGARKVGYEGATEGWKGG